MSLRGLIALWPFLLSNVPKEWTYCDGKNGTPDLRDRFVRGLNADDEPGNPSGSVNHIHEVTGGFHSHNSDSGNDHESGDAYNKITDINGVVGITDEKPLLPPYHSLHFVMHQAGGTMQGLIVIWHDEIANVPNGYTYCNGENDTPDLRDVFLICTGPEYPKDDTGGIVSHDHLITTEPHEHQILPGPDLAAGSDMAAITAPASPPGITLPSSHLPDYKSLVFMMKT